MIATVRFVTVFINIGETKAVQLCGDQLIMDSHFQITPDFSIPCISSIDCPPPPPIRLGSGTCQGCCSDRLTAN